VADFSVANNQSDIVGRKIGTAELLFRGARDRGLQPSWITPNGVFAIAVNDREQYVNFARSPLNSQASASLARDKYLTRRILERHDMQNIPFTRPKSHVEALQFLRDHDKIVAKPVTGSGARDIHVITTAEQLQRLTITRYILEQYIAGTELRYLVLNDEVIGVHRSDYGTSVAMDRPLQRISYPAARWSPTLTATSLKAAAVLGLKFAAVDYLVDESGHAYILEVNTAPGLKWFHAPTSGPAIDVAGQLLEAVYNLSADSSPDSVTPSPTRDITNVIAS
jgi:glutathione synthase/RimK-type ligase-like ATP-grasp enzyme